MANLYDENSIITEDPRTFCRRVPSTYLGSSRTNTNLIKEIFANSVDEHAIGHGNRIAIIVDTTKNLYIVEDNGQGFLVNAKKDENGETVLQRSFDRLNTSGKTTADGVYQGTALGLNGIGAKLTNWLSKNLHVITYRDGQFEEIWFEDGLFVKRNVGDLKHPSGTVVTWSPDPKFFGVNAPDVPALKSHFEIIAAFCPDLTIDAEFNGEKNSYHEPDGIEGYVVRKVGNKEIIPERFVFSRTIEITDYVSNNITIRESQFDKNGLYTIPGVELDWMEGTEHSSKHNADLVVKKSECEPKKRKEKLDICLTYIDGYAEQINAYVNLGQTDSGAHIQAFRTALTRAINKYASDKGLLKQSDKNFVYNEICEGLYVIFNMTTTTAKYDAQNKSRIDDIDSTILNAVIGGDFATWLANNPACVKTITERALTARKAREAAQKAKEKVREASNGKGTKSTFADLPSKLADAYPPNKKDRSRCELYLVEGDSAATTIKATKDSSFQACISLRGKVLNCEKATADKVLANQEIQDIGRATGLESVTDTKSKDYGKLIYDPKKLRYDKFIISTDADPDGADIATGIISALHWLCPELLLNGHLYRVYGALFKVTFKNGEYKLFQNEAELDAWRKRYKGPAYKLARAKGLGELTNDEVEEQLINPETRNLKRLVINDYEKFIHYLDIFKGKSVEPRKKYYEEGILE